MEYDLIITALHIIGIIVIHREFKLWKGRSKRRDDGRVQLRGEVARYTSSLLSAI